MDIAGFGVAVRSTWGNSHDALWRGLIGAVAAMVAAETHGALAALDPPGAEIVRVARHGRERVPSEHRAAGRAAMLDAFALAEA